MKTKRSPLSPGRLIETPANASFSVDSLLLSAFAEPKKSDRVLELGSGCGIVPALFCLHKEFSSFTGVEIDKAAARLAEKNLSENGFSDRAEILCADLKTLSFREEFDLALANPPYFEAKNKQSPDPLRRGQRSEEEADIFDFCSAAGKALKYGGKAVFVWRAERLFSLFCALKDARLTPKELVPIKDAPEKEVKTVLVSAKKGAGEGLKIRRPFCFRTEGGEESEEAALLYREGRMEK